MVRAIEAVIDEQGNVRLLEPVQLPEAQRAIVMILGESPKAEPPHGANGGASGESSLATSKLPLRSLLGLWKDVSISDDVIAEARSELWSNFPREDL